MYNILDELMSQIPEEKIKEASKNLTPDYVAKNLGIKQRTKMQYVSAFKYDDFKKLLKEKNLIKLKLSDIFKYVEKEIEDADRIPVKDGVTNPIENSILCISDNGIEGYMTYFYCEIAYKKAFIYLYISMGGKIVPFVYLTVKLTSGEISYKYHKKIIDMGYVNYEKQDKKVITLFDYFLSANLFIKFSIENRKTIYRKKKATKSSSGERKTNSNSNNKNKIIVLNNDKIIYEIETNSTVQEFKRDYIRHAESWTVRSFDRHYKSGKVVHIKEHVRGNKQTSEVKKNVYTIKGGE